MFPSFSKNLGPINIDIIKQHIECKTINIADNEIFKDFVGIENINSKSLTFLHNNEPSEMQRSDTTIICTEKKYQQLNNINQKALIVNNTQEAVAIVSNLFYRNLTKEEILKLPNPNFGNNCNVNEQSRIENGTIIGNNVRIGFNAFIGHNCIIGDDSKIEENVVITNTVIGENVKIGRNSSIGQTGFGFFLKKNSNIEIYHNGNVVIQSNVRIGSGCTIDRGSFDNTIIGKNTYLDNLCHIAHNVHIGENSTFAAMTGIAGSAKIGNNVLAGGQVGIAGHIIIGNNVQIAAKSGVFNNLKDNEQVMGNPAINKYKFIKTYKKNYGK